MTDSLRRTEYGFVSVPRSVSDLAGFREADIRALVNHPPDMVIVYDTVWDPFHILQGKFWQSTLRELYGYERPMRPEAIARTLSMRIIQRWTHRGLSMSLLEKTNPSGTY